MITFDAFFIPVMPHMTFQDCLQGQHRSFAQRDLVVEMKFINASSITARDVAFKWDDLLEREVVVGDHTSDCTSHFEHRFNCDICGLDTDEACCRFCELTFCGDCQRRGYQYLIHCLCTNGTDQFRSGTHPQ